MMNKFLFHHWIVCALLLSSTVGRAQPLMVNTFAGHDVAGSRDGISSSARFSHPNGIAADVDGNIFVADTANGTIRKITPNGVVSNFAGSVGNFGSADGNGTNAQFFGPQGIAVDVAGFVYVADTANNTIRKISRTGVVSTLAGRAGSINSFDGSGTNANFSQPQALALDNSGNVFVADTGNHTIRKISEAGVVSTIAGTAGNFGGSDGANSKARFNRPAGIAVDGANNVFVADFLNHTIRRITPGGMVSTIAGLAGVWGSADGTNSGARFFQPQGIVADHSSNLWVVDSGNQTIRKISASGTNWIVSTIAGLPGSAGNADGVGGTARFYFPSDIAQDGLGFFYVADFGNHMIRTERIVPPTLESAFSGSYLVSSWPVSANEFVLERAGSLSPGALWVAQTNGLAISGDQFVLTNSLGNGNAFYRLRRP